MTRRHFKFIPALAAGFMAVALTACGGAGISIEPLFAPTINNQPAAQSVTVGQQATFSVTAAGTAPLIYQWQKNRTDISGATSSTYTTPATSITDNGALYSVVVFNGAGTATSKQATLTVSPATGMPTIGTQPANQSPTIGTQPANQSVVAGTTATFTVTATGPGPLTYQWQKDGKDITGGMGATTNTYTTPAMGYAGNSAVYSVVVSNSAGTTTSSSATLTVNKTSTAQSYGQVANASDGLYDKTECVQDNNTGLIWEGKTASGSRLGTSTYTNYDDLNSTQKPSGATYVNPTQTDIDTSTNSIGYRNSVRTSNLCGYNDWRLPTREELQGILASSGSPRIDTTWFPNTQADAYWSSSPLVGDWPKYYAWYVYFYHGRFVYYYVSRGYNNAVRLVRASQ